ncbi:MAG: hypothetical protein QXF12_06955 [Candidatus Aenigmatarchaeota archaeon]
MNNFLLSSFGRQKQENLSSDRAIKFPFSSQHYSKATKQRTSFVDAMIDKYYIKSHAVGTFGMNEKDFNLRNNQVYIFLVNRFAITNLWKAYHSSSHMLSKSAPRHIAENLMTNFLDVEYLDKLINQYGAPELLRVDDGLRIEQNHTHLALFFSFTRHTAISKTDKSSLLDIMKVMHNVLHISIIHNTFSDIQYKVFGTELKDVYNSFQVINQSSSDILHRIYGFILYNKYTHDFRIFFNTYISTTYSTRTYLPDGKVSDVPIFIRVHSKMHNDKSGDYNHVLNYQAGVPGHYSSRKRAQISEQVMLQREARMKLKDDEIKNIMDTLRILSTSHLKSVIKMEKGSASDDDIKKSENRKIRLIYPSLYIPSGQTHPYFTF